MDKLRKDKDCCGQPHGDIDREEAEKRIQCVQRFHDLQQPDGRDLDGQHHPDDKEEIDCFGRLRMPVGQGICAQGTDKENHEQADDHHKEGVAEIDEEVAVAKQ